jgi:hypothetical protein
MVKRARANEVKFGWVGADALYGNNHKFLNALEDSGERFMADIHSNHKVWLARPALDCPSPDKAKRGRPATRFKLKATADRSLHQQVDRICRDRFDKDSVEVSFRQGSKGALTGLGITTWRRSAWRPSSWRRKSKEAGRPIHC